jgi:hypothetical protein
MRLPRFPFAMLRASAHRNDSGMGDGLAMTREVTAPVKNTNKTKYNSRSQKVETGLVEG